jgi:glucose-6-phosphate isomerase
LIQRFNQRRFGYEPYLFRIFMPRGTSSEQNEMSTTEIKIHYGEYQDSIEAALSNLTENHIVTRIWNHDHTVWKPEPTEITNRLGWLDIANRLQNEIGRMTALKKQLIDEGYRQALLLGMGGSSLAPEVFAKTFGDDVDGLSLAVLDSTDPGAVNAKAQNLDLHQTVFIVATKSGGTVETLSFFKYFYNRVLAVVGEAQAGDHFIAITDPGSRLETLANQLNFRETFLNDPNIGGRFSVMSFFGLVPASLVGIDVTKLIERTIEMAKACEAGTPVGQNPGAVLGAVMGTLAQAGRDKITFVASSEIANFGDWVEQLIAESTGKEGKGILPVVGEELGAPEVYGEDRIFVHLRLGDDDGDMPALKALAHAGHPVLHLQLNDKYDFGGQFYAWEFATAVAGYFLEINTFNQPNVESAKVQARKMVAEFEKTGELPKAEYADLSKEALTRFLGDPDPGSYLSLQAYVTPTPEAEALLQRIRLKLRDRYRIATTLGYGPRFLHSTGQLHKGDAGKGYFIQITSQSTEDLPIPDEAGAKPSEIDFQTLKVAQALGDAAALKAAGRRLLRFQINTIEDLKVLLP